MRIILTYYCAIHTYTLCFYCIFTMHFLQEINVSLSNTYENPPCMVHSENEYSWGHCVTKSDFSIEAEVNKGAGRLNISIGRYGHACVNRHRGTIDWTKSIIWAGTGRGDRESGRASRAPQWDPASRAVRFLPRIAADLAYVYQVHATDYW